MCGHTWPYVATCDPLCLQQSWPTKVCETYAQHKPYLRCEQLSCTTVVLHDADGLEIEASKCSVTRARRFGGRIRRHAVHEWELAYSSSWQRPASSAIAQSSRRRQPQLSPDSSTRFICCACSIRA